MRNRFFVIILITLILGAVGFNALAVHFFRNQRIDLINRQIKSSADSLLRSEEFQSAADRDVDVDGMISKVLGSERIGKVFIVRDANGNIADHGFNFSLLQVDLPTKPDWITVQAKDRFVRILNSPLNHGKILQVGLVLDRNFVNWSIIDARTMAFVAGLILGIFLVAVLLTIILLSPIRLLKSHLSTATADLTNLKDVSPLPVQLTRQTAGFWSASDEFSDLIKTVQKLIDRINMNYKLTRSWTLQMAHELKTPLAIIKAETEDRRLVLPAEYYQAIVREIDWTSDTITQFLSWAELENSQPHRNLHVIRASLAAQTVKTRLEKLQPRRIDLKVVSDFSIAASPGHLDQLITNLLVNAIKFSPPDTELAVEIKGPSVAISDQGPGIPVEVLEHLGQPFNVGYVPTDSGFKSTGLGLAWVSTVAKLYGWRIDIKTSNSGTNVSVQFPGID